MGNMLGVGVQGEFRKLLTPFLPMISESKILADQPLAESYILRNLPPFLVKFFVIFSRLNL